MRLTSRIVQERKVNMSFKFVFPPFTCVSAFNNLGDFFVLVILLAWVCRAASAGCEATRVSTA